MQFIPLIFKTYIVQIIKLKNDKEPLALIGKNVYNQ